MGALLAKHLQYLGDPDAFSSSRLVWNGSDFIQNISFDNADLSYADLSTCSFKNCTFRNANFQAADLQECTFYDCTFTGATFVETLLHRVNGLEYSCFAMGDFDMVTCVVIDGSPRYFTELFEGTTWEEWLLRFGINSTEATVIQVLSAMLGISSY